MTLSLVAVLLEIGHGMDHINNFLIFKNVFWHTFHTQPLYESYPNEYFDVNHYGPLFSILIMPFAIIPVKIGAILWTLLNACFLFYVIMQLPLGSWAKNAIVMIVLVEQMTASYSLQINPMIAGSLILSLLLVQRGKLGWATLLIIAGFYIKLYSIVGLSFFFFTKEKQKFFFYSLIWSVLLFLLPMLISSPAFILQSYVDWFHVLVEKNQENMLSAMQDISVMGMVRKISNDLSVSSMLVLIPAAILTLLPILRFHDLNKIRFQFFYLCQLLLGLVIFSSSAESPTYVIAVSGFAIWYVLQGDRPSRNVFMLLVFVEVFTVFSNTDLMPNYLKDQLIAPYALKALPCFVAWLAITWQLLFTNFKAEDLYETNDHHRIASA